MSRPPIRLFSVSCKSHTDSKGHGLSTFSPTRIATLLFQHVTSHRPGAGCTRLAATRGDRCGTPISSLNSGYGACLASLFDCFAAHVVVGGFGPLWSSLASSGCPSHKQAHVSRMPQPRSFTCATADEAKISPPFFYWEFGKGIGIRNCGHTARIERHTLGLFSSSFSLAGARQGSQLPSGDFGDFSSAFFHVLHTKSSRFFSPSSAENIMTRWIDVSLHSQIGIAEETKGKLWYMGLAGDVVTSPARGGQAGITTG